MPLSIFSFFPYIPASLITTSLRRRRSIPYSSGLSFRFITENANRLLGMSLNPLFIRSQFQIIYALCQPVARMRLNPLFIRSQFQMKLISLTSICIMYCLNPLFIRSQFQMQTKTYPISPWNNKSQSLIHQVSVSDNRMLYFFNTDYTSLNPLFIRSQFQIKKRI